MKSSYPCNSRLNEFIRAGVIKVVGENTNKGSIPEICVILPIRDKENPARKIPKAGLITHTKTN